MRGDGGDRVRLTYTHRPRTSQKRGPLFSASHHVNDRAALRRKRRKAGKMSQGHASSRASLLPQQVCNRLKIVWGTHGTYADEQACFLLSAARNPAGQKSELPGSSRTATPNASKVGVLRARAVRLSYARPQSVPFMTAFPFPGVAVSAGVLEPSLSSFST